MLLTVFVATVAGALPYLNYGDLRLTLDPTNLYLGGGDRGSHIVGLPGQTIGWGFAITNSSAYYINVVGATFDRNRAYIDPPTDPLGLFVFNDHSDQNSPVSGGPGIWVAPGGAYSEGFNLNGAAVSYTQGFTDRYGNPTPDAPDTWSPPALVPGTYAKGLAAFYIWPDAPLYAEDWGRISLTYDVYRDNPFAASRRTPMHFCRTTMAACCSANTSTAIVVSIRT